MSQDANRFLSQTRRMEVFFALVKAQDGKMTVGQSRKAVAKRFGVSEKQVQLIEQEGLEADWPPLGE